MNAQSIALAFTVFLVGAHAQLRDIQPGDLVSTYRHELELSSTGRLLIAATRNADTLVLESAGGPAKPVEGLPAKPANIRWGPGGERFAFFAGNVLYVKDASGVHKICERETSNAYLAHSGNSLAWSPDGKWLAFTGTTDPLRASSDPLVISRVLYKGRTAFSDNRRTHLFVVPAEGGSPRALTSGATDEHSIAWASSSDEIIFLTNRAPNADAVLNYDIYGVNVASGALRRITETPGVEMEPQVSPDGRWIAYLATTRRITTIDSMAEDSHVWVVPFKGGPARDRSASIDRRAGAPHWSPDSRSVLFPVQDAGKTAIYRVRPDSGNPERLYEGETQVTAVVGPDASGRLYVASSGPQSPPEVYAMNGGALTAVTDLHQELRERVTLVKPETFWFPSFDGVRIQGWLYWPARHPGKVPLILSIHGGPHGMYGYAFNTEFQYYAAHGYAVLALNPRGSSGYGQKFADGTYQDWGGGDYKDLMAGVDYVLKQHPDAIDATRLAVTGGSYGGYMTNWVITQTNRFRAAVARASVSNLISFYATSLYQDLVHAEYGGFPWEGNHFSLLWKTSPMAHVANVKTPTLFIHGENDNDVHITQAEEMYTALRQQGVDAQLVRYPREGHGFQEPGHRIDSAVRTLEWIERYLK